MQVTPKGELRELRDKLERAEYLLIEAAKLIHQTAAPRTSTRLLMDIAKHIGQAKFESYVL